MITGRIKWFNSNQSYGYIVLSDGSEIYFHSSGILNSAYANHLNPGTTVAFDLIHTRAGMEAANIDLVG